MANSNVGILNLALIELKVPVVASLTEASDAAELATAIWDYIRNMVLEDHDWNFAKLTAELAQVSAYALAPTDPKWDYKYTKPSSCLKIRGVVDESNCDVEYAEEGDYIYTNVDNTESSIYVRYTTIITDPTKYSPSFINAFKYKLAAAMAAKLSAMSPEGFEQKYIYALNHATGINQSQDYIQGDKGNTSWTDR